MMKALFASIVGGGVGAAFLVYLRTSAEWVRLDTWPESVRMAMLIGFPLSFGLGGLIYVQWPAARSPSVLADYGKWMVVLAVAFGGSSIVEAAYSARPEVFVIAAAMGSVAGLSITATSRYLRRQIVSDK